MSSATQQNVDDIGQYLRHVADTLRPFKACEKVGDGIYLLRADGDAQVGRKVTKELLSRGYAVESCYNENLRVRKLSLSDGKLRFEQ